MWCSKLNHWAVACRSKLTDDVWQLQMEESLLSLDIHDNKQVFSHLNVNNQKVKFLLDCGTMVNLLSRLILSAMDWAKLHPQRTTLWMFDRTEFHTGRMLIAMLQHPRMNVSLKAYFYVTDREDPLLGIDACRHLDLLRIVDKSICEVSVGHRSPAASMIDQSRKICQRYHDHNRSKWCGSYLYEISIYTYIYIFIYLFIVFIYCIYLLLDLYSALTC